MSAINLKSIIGITSITTPAGVDNVFTVHTNDTTERFRVDSNGNQRIAGILTVAQDLDVDGHTNLDNVSIAGVTSTSDNVRILGTNKLQFADNQSLQIYYDNSSYITNNNAGHLFLKTLNGGSDIRLEANDDIFLLTAAGTRNSIICRDYAQVELYYNNTKRLETTNTGVTVTGTVAATSYTGDGSNLTGISAGSIADNRQNTYFGTEAGSQLSGGSGSRYNNTFYGYQAGKSNTGIQNVAFGDITFKDNSSGNNNTALGRGALWQSTTASNNTGVGRITLGNVSTGSNNTAVGAQAGYSGTNDLTTGSNNLLLGYQATASSATVSNEITLGDANINHLRVPGIGVSFSEGGAVIAGIATFTGPVSFGGTATFKVNQKLYFSDGANNTFGSAFIYADNYNLIVENGNGAGSSYFRGNTCNLQGGPSNYTGVRVSGSQGDVQFFHQNGIIGETHSSGEGGIDIKQSLRHFGDTDTLIEFETNQINFDTGGSERLRIASGGDTTVCQNGGAFGVGGTPINKFGVTSSGNDFFGLHRSNASTGTGEFNINIESNSQVTFSMDDEGAFSFGTSTDPSAQSGYSEKFRIDANGNIKAGRVASALDFTNSNSGDRFIEIGANQGDALLVTHASGYGVAYFGYERGGDRLVIACDNGGGNNNIDFITDAGTTTGGGTDNLNGKSAKMRLSANGILKIGSGAIGNTNIKGTSGTGNEGIYLQPSDVAQFAVSNGPVMALNRKTSEGRVFEVRYNGSVRGYFDTNGSSLPSDKNYKTDISDLSLGLSFVNKLKPSQFRFKDSESTSPILYGLIAQDVEESLTSEGVSQNSTQMLQYKVIADDDNESDYYLDYGKLTPVLINAVKELSTEIDKLKAEIAALKSS